MLLFFLDICSTPAIIQVIAKQISLRGAGCIRLRVESVVQTREPDTVSTVGGKDAYMGYLCVALHLDGLQCDSFFLWRYLSCKTKIVSMSVR